MEKKSLKKIPQKPGELSNVLRPKKTAIVSKGDLAGVKLRKPVKTPIRKKPL